MVPTAAYEAFHVFQARGINERNAPHTDDAYLWLGARLLLGFLKFVGNAEKEGALDLEYFQSFWDIQGILVIGDVRLFILHLSFQHFNIGGFRHPSHKEE